MSSAIISKQITNTTQDALFWTSETWCDVVAKLDASAGAATELSFRGGSKFLMVPGESYRFSVEPKTEINIETTSADPVRVDLIVSTQVWIEEMLNCIHSLGELMKVLGELRGR